MLDKLVICDIPEETSLAWMFYGHFDSQCIVDIDEECIRLIATQTSCVSLSNGS